jgi:hypothetical protein
LVNLFTVFGLGSLFIGVTSAAIRFGALTEIMNAYAQASGAERETLAVVAKVLADVIFLGLGTLEVGFLGLWLLGTGLVLRRERRALGLFAMILSIGYFGALAGAFLQIDALVALFTGIIIPLFTILTVWLGVAIWRRDEQRKVALEPAAAV